MWRVNNEEKKLVLRGAVIAKRNALTSQQRLRLSRAVQARALQLPAYQASRSVALYSATQNEVSTEEIFNDALVSGRKIFYPRTAADGSCEFIAVSSSADLGAGRFGIREPSGTARLSKDDCSALTIFVPAVAFDRVGNRLGRGKGWYDRMLAWQADKATVVGLGYEFQIVEEVPISTWDKRVHYIVTEDQVIDCDAVGATLGSVRSKRKGVF